MSSFSSASSFLNNFLALFCFAVAAFALVVDAATLDTEDASSGPGRRRRTLLTSKKNPNRQPYHLVIAPPTGTSPHGSSSRCSAEKPIVLNSSPLIVGSGADLITVHKEFYVNGGARYSIRGCGSLIDLSSGKKIAIICTTGAVDESSPTSSVYMKVTMCGGTFGLVGQVPIKIQYGEDDTFAFVASTKIEATVVSATEKFKQDLGKRATFNFPFFSIPQPVTVINDDNTDGFARDRTLVAVSTPSAVVITVDKAKIAASPKGVCFSPPGKASFIKACAGEKTGVSLGATDGKIYCSQASNGVKTCLGAGITVGSDGVCFSGFDTTGGTSGSTGAGVKTGLTLCCGGDDAEMYNIENICKAAAEEKGLTEEDPPNDTASTEDSDVFQVQNAAEPDPSKGDGDGTEPVSNAEPNSEEKPEVDPDSDPDSDPEVDPDGASTDTVTADVKPSIGKDPADDVASTDTVTADVDPAITETADLAPVETTTAAEGAGEGLGEELADGLLEGLEFLG